MTNAIPQQAAALGLTRHVFVSNGQYDFEGYISPDADIDSTFIMYDEDEKKLVRINGWMADIDDLE